ncbi:chromate transporter [Duganella aceris]|uniref:Chromate transporter n=1 Tax=Duganella aceris TaxID=2703883 RepID=A0ABX0FUQ1_9BURK|nr:chromate transporter [Duganella aceris]NGZ88184.1 chromate transporter [Duganella aceris]
MDEQSPVWELSLHIAVMSLMAVGGGVVLLGPQVGQYVVEVQHWLTGGQFAAAYAIAQAAPGPNLLFISLVGWLIAGWTGAILTTLAVLVPSTLLTLSVVRMNTSRFSGRLSTALGVAFAPISIGFLAATGWLFARMSNPDWRADVLTALAALILLRTKLNPVLLIAVGAALGMAQL